MRDKVHFGEYFLEILPKLCFSFALLPKNGRAFFDFKNKNIIFIFQLMIK